MLVQIKNQIKLWQTKAKNCNIHSESIDYLEALIENTNDASIIECVNECIEELEENNKWLNDCDHLDDFDLVTLEVNKKLLKFFARLKASLRFTSDIGDFKNVKNN